MTTALALLIVASPFAVAAALSAAAHRTGILREKLDQLRVHAPPPGRSADVETGRGEHEIDAIRTRFEKSPSWPTAGALGERR